MVHEKRFNVFTVSLVALVFFSPLLLAQASSALAKDSLERSQNTINFMKGNGFATNRVDDLLFEAKLFFDSGKYDEVQRIERDIAALRDRAFLLREQLGSAQALLLEAQSLGYNSSTSWKSINGSLEAFALANYELSEDILEDVQIPLQIFLKDHLQYLWNVSEEFVPIQASIGSTQATLMQQRIEQMRSNGSFAGISLLSEKTLLLNDSAYLLVSAKNEISKLQSQSINTQRLQDSYAEALVALELQLFEKTIEESNHLLFLAQEIEALQGLMEETQSRADSLSRNGLDTKSAQSLIEQARAELNAGSPDRAKTLLQMAQDQLSKVQSSFALNSFFSKRTNALLPFLKKYWYVFALGILFVLFVGFFTHRLLAKRLLSRRIQRLHTEEQMLLELMKKDQQQYYKEKSMSKATYESRTDASQQQLLVIRETLPGLESKLERIVSSRQKKR